MIEIIINKKENNKNILLIENGKVIENYEKNKNIEEMKEGKIYIGKIKDIIPGMQAAFVDIGTEKNAFIHLKDILPKINEKEENKSKNDKVEIKNVVNINEKILVQIKKDSTENKGARISKHISLAGRNLIFMPDTNIITISQKIDKEKEIERLIKIVKENIPEGNGAVIRTSANGKKNEEIINEINSMYKKWNEILKEFNNSKETSKLLYKNPDIVEKILIDLYDKKIERILVNDEKIYKEIEKTLSENIDYTNIQLEIKKENLLEMYDIEKQIEKTKSRKIWLNCGGFITIDKTEALTAIDVNTGKYTGKQNVENTIYKVNYEATLEIAKQLRLRDIGGIIIIDYIDMHDKENKNKITNLLREVLKQDRAKTQVEGFTKLDLMEMTRKHICSHNG